MNLESFKKELNKRLQALILANIFLVSLLLSFNSLFRINAEFKDIHMFLSGLAVGFEFLVVVNILKLSLVVKDEKKLEELYIKETDERGKLIREKSIISSFYLVIFAIIVGIIFHLFFPINGIFVLIAILAIAAISKKLFSRYYEKKY